MAATAIAAGLLLNVINHRSNAGLTAPVGHDIVFSVWAAAYATVGALIAVRKPGNIVGWLLLAAPGCLLADTANREARMNPYPFTTSVGTSTS